jgi:hypothetical protein
MRKAVVHCARPMLTTPPRLHQKKDRMFFTPHPPYALIQGTLPPAKSPKGTSAGGSNKRVLWEGPRVNN